MPCTETFCNGRKLQIFDFLSDPTFLVPYAIVQAVVLLLLIRYIDLYEREPMPILGLMALWGAVAAPALVLALRERLIEILPTGNSIREAMSAALVEEPIKGVALLSALFLSYAVARRYGELEFEGVTDGVVYGVAVGLGFAFTENIFYLVQQESILKGFETFSQRADFVGLTMLGHGVYTGVFGAGLGLATWEKSWLGRIGFPILGLGVGIFMHAVHNGLSAAGLPAATRGVDFLFFLLFIGGMVMWLRYQRHVIGVELQAEVEDGLITEKERDTVWNYRKRARSYIDLARAQKFHDLRLTKLLHAELVDLAFQKWRHPMLTADPRPMLDKRRVGIRKLREALSEDPIEPAAAPAAPKPKRRQKQAAGRKPKATQMKGKQ